MAKKICTYCGKEGQLTREHIIPARLIRAQISDYLQFLLKTVDFIKVDVTIQDVCKTCNNVFLHKLDSYLKILCEKHLR